MSEMTPLEQELAGMRPKELPGDLLDGLVEGMRGEPARGSWPDRLLIGAMGSGVAAAVVIVAILSVQNGGPDGAGAGAGPSLVATAHGQQTVGEALAVLARADGTWDEVVK